jgi:hypothetical protein
LVEAYVSEDKKAHPQSSQTGVRPGAAKDRRFTPHIAALTLAEGADQAAVLFVIAKPLASFLLSAADARVTAARLIKAADEIDAEVNQS